MGGKAKIILPLVALGIATGGFGLAGAGAAGAGGVSAAGAAAAESAGLAGLGAGGEFALSSVGAGAVGSAALAESAGLAGLGAAGEFGSVAAGSFPVPIAASGPLTATPASTGFFTQIGENLASLTPLEKVNLAFAGINAVAQQNALSVQDNENKISESYKRLGIAEKELDNQKKLGKTLATQRNLFATVGVNASQGSAAQLQNSAFGEAGLNQDKFTAERSLLNASSDNSRRDIALRRRGVNNTYLKTGLGTLLKI